VTDLIEIGVKGVAVSGAIYNAANRQRIVKIFLYKLKKI
jgi:thiamine monophosphate synthase